MEHVVRIEATLNGDAARLYEVLSETCGESFSEVNAAFLQTGIVHHAIMLHALE